MTATPVAARPITHLNFDNSYARLPDTFHASATAAPLPDPELVHFNVEVAALLDLDPSEGARAELVRYCAGEEPIPGSQPVAMAYAGHQFGQFVPSLGDGRALLLGEVVNEAGARWDLHLKGSGPTQFARGFDGRSVLRSAIREHVAGEALHGLGIPTTRALAIVASSEPVLRERMERAAALLRVAESHVRFGTFEWFAARGDRSGLSQLTEYLIARHFPQWRERADRDFLLLREAVTRTATLVARWQAVGFTHGVLNTDNMSILGLTLDFGPYGFMDQYQRAFVSNHSDPLGRYAFQRQPAIAYWNVEALATAIDPLLERGQAEDALAAFAPTFSQTLATLFRAKLGFQDARDDDAALVSDLLEIMEEVGADFTLSFRGLGGITQLADARGVVGLLPRQEWRDAWLRRYRARLASEAGDDAERQVRMDAANPVYVLRQWLAQRAIGSAERGDYSEIETLLRLLRQPFVPLPGADAYASPPPPHLVSPQITCSS